MPIIEWHFGATRSGKTYTAYLVTGGRDNPECYYHSGNLDWIQNYTGQKEMLINEFRKSSPAAFGHLLHLLEGWGG